MSTRSSRTRKLRQPPPVEAPKPAPPPPTTRQRKTATVPSKANGPELVGKLAKVAWPDPDGELVFYDSFVIGYTSRNRKHKVIYLEEESIEVCELGTGPRYRAWQPKKEIPEDPLIGAYLRFVDNETGNDKSWFDFMRIHPNRTSQPFFVYVYAPVKDPEENEVSGPKNLNKSASQYYRIVHAPNDFITTVDLSCVDHTVEDTIKLWDAPEKSPNGKAENKIAAQNGAENGVEADATTTPAKPEAEPEEAAAEEKQDENPSEANEDEGPNEGSTERDGEKPTGKKETASAEDSTSAPTAADVTNKEAKGDEDENAKEGTAPKDQDKDASEEANEESTPSRSRVRTSQTKSVDVIPDDKNLPENTGADEGTKDAAEAEDGSEANGTAEANGSSKVVENEEAGGPKVDVDPMNSEMQTDQKEEAAGQQLKRQREEAADASGDNEQPSRKLRRKDGAKGVAAGAELGEQVAEAVEKKIAEAVTKVGDQVAEAVEKKVAEAATEGQDTAAQQAEADKEGVQENGNGEMADSGLRPVSDVEASPATTETRDEPLSGPGSSRRRRASPVSEDGDEGDGVNVEVDIDVKVDVGIKAEDDGDEGVEMGDSKGGVKESLMTSRVGDYISVDTGSGTRRKAYVEAYLPTMGTHFVAFCDARAGTMQVKLTEENHEVLDDKQAAQLTREQSRSKVDAIPMPDIDDDPPQGMLDLGNDGLGQDEGDDAGVDDLADNEERRGSKAVAPSSEGRRKSSRRTSQPVLLSPSKAGEEPSRSRRGTGSNSKAVIPRRGKMRRTSQMKVLGKSAREEIVSRCITVVWPNTMLVYVALVLGYSPESKQHMVIYMVDHCVEVLELKYREWEVLQSGKEPWNSSGMIGKRVFVWWPGEYNSAEAQRRAERLFGDESNTKVAYEAYVLEYSGDGVYKIVYPCNEDTEERALTADRSDPESPLDKEWDILPEGVNEVMGLPVIGWEG